MPKLILRCNYLKNAPPSHLANYMNYISTREGVEKIDNTCGLLPATVKQKELIADILSKIEDADRIEFDTVFVGSAKMTRTEKYIAYTRALGKLVIVVDAEE